jgi:hypothetical protein
MEFELRGILKKRTKLNYWITLPPSVGKWQYWTFGG